MSELRQHILKELEHFEQVVSQARDLVNNVPDDELESADAIFKLGQMLLEVKQRVLEDVITAEERIKEIKQQQEQQRKREGDGKDISR